MCVLLHPEHRRQGNLISALSFLCLTFKIFRSLLFPALVSGREEEMKQARK